jgi:hypothetical protein
LFQGRLYNIAGIYELSDFWSDFTPGRPEVGERALGQRLELVARKRGERAREERRCKFQGGISAVSAILPEKLTEQAEYPIWPAPDPLRLSGVRAAQGRLGQ